MAGQKILGKRLGTFQLGGGGGRAEDGQPLGAERIDHPFHQRRFRPDDGQTDALLLGKRQQGRDVGGRDGHVLEAPFMGGAGIAGGDEDPGHQRGLLGLPGQGVFTTPLPMISTFIVSLASIRGHGRAWGLRR